MEKFETRPIADSSRDEGACGGERVLPEARVIAARWCACRIDGKGTHETVGPLPLPPALPAAIAAASVAVAATYVFFARPRTVSPSDRKTADSSTCAI